MPDKKPTQSQDPVKVCRQGAIAASIWKRQAPSGFEYFDFSVSRSWKSQKSGKEGYSQNFFASNEAELATAIQDACLWIAQHQGDLETAHGSNQDSLDGPKKANLAAK